MRSFPSVREAVEVVIRPENVYLAKPNGGAGTRAAITDRTFLGNISEYYAALPSGLELRVQTHPLQDFAVGEAVAVTVDAGQCSVFKQ